MLVPPPSFDMHPTSANNRGWVLFALGFRPFFLLAGAWALLAVPLWLAVLYGLIPAPHMPPFSWHAHEMIFGYTGAVIIGFLLTAVRNWTERPTPTGAALAALATAWIAGRIGPWLPDTLGAGLQFVGILPLVALPLVIGIPITATRNRRNYGIVVVVFALAAAQTGLWWWRQDPGRTLAATEVGLTAAAVLIAWIGGRVIPFFTARGIAGTQPQPERWALAVWATAAWGLAKLTGEPALLAATSALAAALHGQRLRRWYDHRIWEVPLVWVLHVGYAWLALAAGLDVLAALGLAPATAARHALTVGAIGTLTLGMMARVSLGHTGRMLQAPRRTAAGFGMITGAAVLRVLAAWIPPVSLPFTLMLSGFLWSSAFAAFLLDYTPILVRPRVDGRPG